MFVVHHIKKLPGLIFALNLPLCYIYQILYHLKIILWSMYRTYQHMPWVIGLVRYHKKYCRVIIENT